MTTIEKTLILLKPDAVQRKLVGRIISRFEEKGLDICLAKCAVLDRALIEKHYEEHNSRDFFKKLCDFMTSGPVFVLIFSGKKAISVARILIGQTDSAVASPGTIRGDFSLDKGQNLIHASDSAESARREIQLFFPGVSE